MDYLNSKKIRREYLRLLDDPHWEDFTSEVADFYHNACWCCGSTDSLHVHHLVYYEGRLPWEYEVSEVRLLCAVCHAAIHAVADVIWVQCLRFQPHELELILKMIKEDMRLPTNQTPENLEALEESQLREAEEQAVRDFPPKKKAAAA